MSTSRFISAASDFQLDELVTRLRKGFLLALVAAAGLHLALASINPFEKTQTKAPRPMSTKFIKREPRLTKVLELRKIPQPKRQLARRQVRLAAARLDQVQATANFNTRSLIASHVGGSGISLAGQANFSAVSTVDLEPKLVASSVTSTRSSEHKIDMALEMLDVNSMDTGRYRAIVIQDATDKQGVKGFLKMAHVISARSIAAGTVGGANLNLRSIDGLCDVLNEYTGLQASFIGTITYDDERMLEIPIIIPQGAPNESELEHLARYMLAGGFIMGGYWREALVKYGGLVEGQDFWTERLSDGHPIFSAFFDLKSGLGGGGGGAWRDIVTGYFIHGRLAGITGVGWGANIRSNQMAVNIVVYALTQEGSITQRLMQMVN